MLDVKQLILDLRVDLRETMRFGLPENRDAFMGWLITSGLSEYKALRENPALIGTWLNETEANPYSLTPLQYLLWQWRGDLQAQFPLPRQRKAYLDWFYTFGVSEYGYWGVLAGNEQRLIDRLPEPGRSQVLYAIAQQQIPPVESVSFSNREFGVNVIGYAFGQLGIGEDARMAARALQAADVPMTMLNFAPGADIGQNDTSMAEYVSGQGEFAFNLFCMTAEEQGRYFLENGGQQLDGRYNIGYWPWELGRWPSAWEQMLALVDEVWVSSRHTYQALAPVCNKPLHWMPMAVDIGSVTAFADRAAARRHFKLPEAAVLFCFSFDLNSYVARKNPQACVDAFLRAFDYGDFGADAVGLVIKAHKPKQQNPAWERLKSLAEHDQRIHIVETTLPRPDLLALYQACDCFLSLHRAEGFGRGLAEALQLGLHVICTGYSGNVDFCKPPAADLVDFALVEVGSDEYPHAQGQVWAEPDISHAAELMRRFALAESSFAPRQWPEFSLANVGANYKKRLQQILAERAASASQNGPN